MTHIHKYFCLVFFLFSNLVLAIDKHVDEARLKEIAETQGYGYKFANLIMLKELAEEFTKSENRPQIAVPAFEGISSDAVFGVLNKFANLNIRERWADLLRRYLLVDQAAQTMFATKKFPDGFLKEAKKLEFDIINAFKTMDATAVGDFLLPPNAKSILADAASSEARLMIRSSGKEDTKELANAGGNKSIPNVEPTIDEVFRWIGHVVGSYFSGISLKQRLNAGDKSLLEGVPLTPVLMQRMIGERSGELLPKCGVMFTEDAEGGISAIDPNTTSGITLIQAAYGHNEAVVNSRILVDSYYIDHANNIYPIIRLKTHRMAPLTESGKLSLVRNNKDWVKRATLSSSELLQLKSLANRLEEFYRGPMDVEFVASAEENIIYVVQARPIIHKADLPPPSYLLEPDKFLEKFSGETIGVAGGSLRLIDSLDQIIIAEKINDALKIYLNQNEVPDKSRVEAIIVGRLAPSTSHEATSFRNEGKPVVYMPNWVQIKELVEKKNARLLISPQQSLVINWPTSEEKLEDILSNASIAQRGWETYPAPPLLSLRTENLAPDMEKTYKEFFSQASVDDREYKDISREALFSILKKADKTSVDQALNYLARSVERDITKAVEDVIITPSKAKQIDALKIYFAALALRIKENADYQPTEPLYSRRLLATRFFHNFFTQEPRRGEVVDGNSIDVLIGKVLPLEQEIVRSYRGFNLDARSVQYLLVRTMALTAQLKASWSDFVIKLHKLPNADDIREKFQTLFKRLRKYDLLPVWLHTSFVEAHRQFGDDVTAIAQSLVEEYQKEKKFIETLANKRVEISALNVESFSDPKAFDAQWKTFSDVLTNYFISNEFLDAYKAAQRLGKLAALSTMLKFVDSFDLSIKALRGSRDFKIKQFIANLQTMLLQSSTLFKKWVALVPEGSIRYNSGVSVNNHIFYIDQVLNNSNLKQTNIDATPGFNVSAFTIGSGNMIDTTDPKPASLDDIFSILHQSLLVTLSALNTEAGINNIERPQVLVRAEQMLRTLVRNDNVVFTDSTGQISLVGVELGADHMSLSYNLPLGAHSFQSTLRYNKATDDVVLMASFFGHNPPRWYQIATFIDVLASLEKIKLVDVNATDNGMTYSILLSKNSDWDEIKRHVQQTIFISNNQVIDLEKYLGVISEDMKITLANILIDRLDSYVIETMDNFAATTAEHMIDTNEGLALTQRIFATKPRSPNNDKTLISMLSLAESLVARNVTASYRHILQWLLALWHSDVQKGSNNQQRIMKILANMEAPVEEPEKITALEKIISAIDKVRANLGDTEIRPTPHLQGISSSNTALFTLFFGDGGAIFDASCNMQKEAPCTLVVNFISKNNFLTMEHEILLYLVALEAQYDIELKTNNDMNLPHSLVIKLGPNITTHKLLTFLQTLVNMLRINKIIHDDLTSKISSHSTSSIKAFETINYLLMKIDTKRFFEMSLHSTRQLVGKLFHTEKGLSLLRDSINDMTTVSLEWLLEILTNEYSQIPPAQREPVNEWIKSLLNSRATNVVEGRLRLLSLLINQIPNQHEAVIKLIEETSTNANMNKLIYELALRVLKDANDDQVKMNTVGYLDMAQQAARKISSIDQEGIVQTILNSWADSIFTNIFASPNVQLRTTFANFISKLIDIFGSDLFRIAGYHPLSQIMDALAPNKDAPELAKLIKQVIDIASTSPNDYSHVHESIKKLKSAN